VVPFCRRTSTLFRGEWVCVEHWRMVDPALRRLRGRLVRRWRRLGWLDEPGRWRAVERAYEGWWRRVKRQAIERAAGIVG